MHISDGILSTGVLVTGAILSAAGIGAGLKKTDNQDLPEVAVVSSIFFIASLIHVPIGPTSVHLVLNGLVGILLGISAFPAIVTGLFLQAVLFQFGGFTTLGVNTFNMAFPALISFWIFRKAGESRKSKILFAFTASLICGCLTLLLFILTLISTDLSFLTAAKILAISYTPIIILEAIIVAMVVGFILKVKPEILDYCHKDSKTQSI